MPKITAKDILQEHIIKPQKRKKAFASQPVAKRSKQVDSSDSEEHGNRFKYILAPKRQHRNDISPDKEDVPVVKTLPKYKKKDKKKQTKKVDENGNNKKKMSKDKSRNLGEKKKKPKDMDNGTKEDKMKSIARYNEESETDTSDESYLFDDTDSLTTEDESCSEEWSTDTDYSPHSFHESDCDIVESDNTGSNENVGYFNYNSSDDDDYVPPIEDVYIKKGDAKIYEGKGLNLAFGDSSESQIIDLNDVSAAVVGSDEEIPKLVQENESEVECENTQESETLSKSINVAEDTMKNLSLDDEEAIESSQLPKRAVFYDCINKLGVILKLKRTIHFHGILVIKPLFNTIQINGFTLPTNQSLKATSISRTDYYLNLTPVICENSNIDRNELHEKLSEFLQTKSDVDEILKDFDEEKDVLLHLQQGLPDKKIEMLETYLSDRILPHKNMILKKSVFPTSELILATKFFADIENPKLNGFKINADWENIELNSNMKLMIIGGKNVGKTGMAQYMINKYISKYPKILLVDLDIGQPICSPSQTVSATVITQPLIGAGYLNNARVEKSYFFGDKSVMVSPFKYNECVSKLLEFCEKNEGYKNIPWIINTMGYQKGFGLQLMCLLIRIIQPTDVVQIQHSNPRYNFKCTLHESFVNNFTFNFFSESYLQKYPREVFFTTHVLDSIVNNKNNNSQSQDDDEREWTSNATEKRKISILAHLSKLMKAGQTYLNDVVPLGCLIEKIRLIVIDEDYDIATQQDNSNNGVNLDLFNGNLVYLCHSDNNNEVLDSNSILECFGIGIVRAIDKIHNYIYILLPQQDDFNKLRSMINVLAIGNIPLPSEILLKQNFAVNGAVPHVTFFKDRNMSNKKLVNKRKIKDIF